MNDGRVHRRRRSSTPHLSVSPNPLTPEDSSRSPRPDLLPRPPPTSKQSQRYRYSYLLFPHQSAGRRRLGVSFEIILDTLLEDKGTHSPLPRQPPNIDRSSRASLFDLPLPLLAVGRYRPRRRDATLRETLSPWARSSIARVGFMFDLLCTPGPSTLRDEEEQDRRSTPWTCCRMRSKSC